MTVFSALKNKEIIREAIPIIIENWISDNSQPIENVISEFNIMGDSELEESIQTNGKKSELSEIKDAEKKHRYLMGLVMGNVRGRVEGKKVSEFVTKFLEEK